MKRAIIICLLFVLCACASKDDNKMNQMGPGINVDGKMYWISSKDNATEDLKSDYEYIGTIAGHASQANEEPDKELYTTQVMSEYLHYKAYFSYKENCVAIWNEKTQKYEYYYQ